jgi:hypothetical protein
MLVLSVRAVRRQRFKFSCVYGFYVGFRAVSKGIPKVMPFETTFTALLLRCGFRRITLSFGMYRGCLDFFEPWQINKNIKEWFN